jgi:hypothetical protein
MVFENVILFLALLRLFAVLKNDLGLGLNV